MPAHLALLSLFSNSLPAIDELAKGSLSGSYKDAYPAIVRHILRDLGLPHSIAFLVVACFLLMGGMHFNACSFTHSL